MTAAVIDPRVEALARAMCAALDIDPDKMFSHGADWNYRPRINREDGPVAVVDILLRSPNWVRYAWAAEKWIYETSGGELP